MIALQHHLLEDGNAKKSQISLGATRKEDEDDSWS